MINENKKRVCYRLVGSDGTVYGVAGQRWILEIDIQRGTYYDTDDTDNLVELPLPTGCIIVELPQ